MNKYYAQILSTTNFIFSLAGAREQFLYKTKTPSKKGLQIYFTEFLSIVSLNQTPSPYGTGHANDIAFVFGYPYVRDYFANPSDGDYWPGHFCGTEPSPWHYSTADLMVENFTQFIKTGKPLSYWMPFGSSEFDTLYIRNNETSVVAEMATGWDANMQFWINEYCPAYNCPI